MSTRVKILYLDDELSNLVGFKASFRMDYMVFTASTSEEALDHLRKHSDIRIIFCDQRMPEKTGVEFFEEIRTEFPLPIRILLTGYTDIEAVIDAINRGNIFRYVKKPWLDEDIISAIEEASKFYLANSMLSSKNAELQKAYNELDKFATSVSHDIRGPLSGVLGGIHVAQKSDDIHELKEMLGLMEKSVNQLDEFIRSMHDYYSIRRGDLNISVIDFDELVKNLQDIYEIYGKVNKVHFSTTIDQEGSFRCDELSLKLILNNLLSNAFKYQKLDSENKFVDLSISVSRGVATFRVKDNGIGIPPHHIQEVFNLFFRASAQAPGSGFGLYNVKDATMKLNGEIQVESNLDEGTVVEVVIPTK
ncbi:MAG: hybrid sensor histidine kinase/response regulator [Sphingobacteriaceae bacterium]|jgi:signal transduction histidine kinase|nr:hybrid sensor histidine kinase/response regulator [Sphingobacteriaceae bacterium]